MRQIIQAKVTREQQIALNLIAASHGWETQYNYENDRYPWAVIEVGKSKLVGYSLQGKDNSEKVYTTVSFAEIVDRICESVVNVRLNSECIANIVGDTVKVGCQTFSKSVVKELYQACFPD